MSDYNASTNPGRFRVVNEGDGRFAIVGISVKGDDGQDQPVNPILDTLISIPTDTRDAYTTIETILNVLTVESGTKVALFTVPTNALAHSQVTVGGQGVSARVLLLQTLSAAKLKLYWRLYYDHDVNMYGFSLLSLDEEAVTHLKVGHFLRAGGIDDTRRRLWVPHVPVPPAAAGRSWGQPGSFPYSKISNHH